MVLIRLMLQAHVLPVNQVSWQFLYRDKSFQSENTNEHYTQIVSNAYIGIQWESQLVNNNLFSSFAIWLRD